MSDEEQELIPIEQQTLIFYGKPIIVVRLPDGRPAVVLRFLCENLQLETNGQVRRIRRTEAIADDLVLTRVRTEGGPQRMSALVLHGVPFWLAGIDPKRVGDDARPEILRYQREVVDVLYAWALTPRAIAAPTDLVPVESVTKPERPAEDAPLAAWREYYQRMLALVEWQMDVEEWRGSVESRLEGLEEVTSIILEHIGPQTLTLEHQRVVQYYVKQLHEATGKPYGTIYDNLKTAFAVPRYQEILESEWQNVVNWFKVQLDRKKK